MWRLEKSPDNAITLANVVAVHDKDHREKLHNAQ